jgi:hypothetical protein
MASSDQILQAIVACQPNYNRTPNLKDGEEDGPNWHYELLTVLHQIRIELANHNAILVKINNLETSNL